MSGSKRLSTANAVPMSPHCTGGNPLLLPTPNRVISLRFRPLVPPVGAVRTGEAKSRFQAPKGGGHHEIPARPTGSSLVIMVPPEVRVFHFPREIAIDFFFPVGDRFCWFRTQPTKKSRTRKTNRQILFVVEVSKNVVSSETE